MTSRPMGRLSQQPFFNQLFGTHAMDGYFFLGTHLMDHYFRKLLGTRGREWARWKYCVEEWGWDKKVIN
jgi:hypothetical protein